MIQWVGMRSHQNHSTSSPGKLEQHWKVAAFFNPCERLRSGFRYTLVGDSDGLARHILEHRKEGFKQEQMIVVERDLITYSALRAEASKLKFRGEILCGDFLDVVLNDAVAGRKIAHLDFDGVEAFNRNGFAEEFFTLIQQTGAESYTYTYNPRGKADTATERLCERLGLQKKLCKKSNGIIDTSLDQGKVRAPRYRSKELAEIFVTQMLPYPWHHSEAQDYRGVRSKKNDTNNGGSSMGFIMGKNWTLLDPPFIDKNL